MKYIITQFILLLLLAGNSMQAQAIEENFNDAATGTRMLLTRNSRTGTLNLDDSVARRGALFFAAGYQGSTYKGAAVSTYYIELTILHNDNRLGCLQEFTGKAILTLADGSTVECYQISESDCGQADFKASFALIPRGGSMKAMAENFKKLLAAQIVMVDVIATEGSLNYKIKQKDQQYLQKHFALIDKTLNADTVAK